MARGSWTGVEAAASLELAPEVVTAMRTDLPRVAEQVVLAVSTEVPSYADPFRGQMGRNIETAVTVALGGFLGIASGEDAANASDPSFEEVYSAAYDLGRGEARSGRTMDALLSAYRVGSRVAWRDLGDSAVGAGMPAESVARFAELVFAYIDELSAASAAGHADELATSGRVRQRYLERLTQNLLRGRAADVLEAAAERAEWRPPKTLTAVLLPDARSRSALAQLDSRTLQPTEQVPGLEEHADLTVLLVPDVGGRRRGALLRRLTGSEAVVGPARAWQSVQSSYERALRMLDLELDRGPAPLDTEAHLPDLILSSDPAALEDLRAQVLGPLDDLRPAAAEKLRETLRSWLLHQGRREEIAAELFVHQQTVRYRMQQLRDVYGDRLQDPDWVLRLTIALA